MAGLRDQIDELQQRMGSSQRARAMAARYEAEAEAMQDEIAALQGGAAEKAQQSSNQASFNEERDKLKRHIMAMDTEMFDLQQQLSAAEGVDVKTLREQLKRLQEEGTAKVRNLGLSLG